MRVLAGTSGFSFDEWQGRFYPRGLSAQGRLPYYASRLQTVEINNTFYQMPKSDLLARWRQAVPDEFRFSLKAPRRITHIQRLKPEGDTLERFVALASTLDGKLGAILFQLPPFVRKDVSLLAEFLDRLPTSFQICFEFRHASWMNDSVFALLADRNAALCCGEADPRSGTPPFVATADFGYLRLRAPSYDAPTLHDWLDRIHAQAWRDAYIYLKHEVLGTYYAAFIASAANNEPEPALPTEFERAQTSSAPVTKGLVRAEPRAALDVRHDATPARRRKKAS